MASSPAPAQFFGWVEKVDGEDIIVRTGIGLQKYFKLDKKDDLHIYHEDFIRFEEGEKSNYEIISRSYIDTKLYSKNDGLIILCRSFLVDIARDILKRDGLVEIFVPAIIKGHQFPTQDPFFKLENLELSQSSQQYLEFVIPLIGNCFCLGFSYRNEAKEDPRHLKEFLHLEVEWIGILTLDQHIQKIKKFILELISEFRVKAQYILKELNRDLNFLDLECPVINGKEWDGRIDKLLILVDPPRDCESFDIKDGCGVDIMVPEMGEIIGSGIRENDLGNLADKIKKSGCDVADYSKYLSMRILGHGRTSGFGLGVDRLLTWLLGLKDIREAATFS